MPKKNIGDRDPDHIRRSLEMLYYIYKRTEKIMPNIQYVNGYTDCLDELDPQSVDSDYLEGYYHQLINLIDGV